MRDTTKKPKGNTAETPKLVGTDEEFIYKTFKQLLEDQDEYDIMSKTSNPYGDRFASKRIVDIIAAKNMHYTRGVNMTQDAVNESFSNIQIKNSTDLANDIKLVKFIWAFYLIQIINAVIKIVFDIDDKLWSLLSNVFMIVIIIFLVRIIKIIFRRNFSKLILAEGIILILFAISLLMGNANTDILTNFFFWTAGVNILLGITYFSIIQKDIFFKYSIRYSNYVLIIGMIGFLFMGKQHVYIMSLAYFMLLPITILINHLFDKFSISQFLIVATSIALILILEQGVQL